jgi:hypothetical protein
MSDCNVGVLGFKAVQPLHLGRQEDRWCAAIDKCKVKEKTIAIGKHVPEVDRGRILAIPISSYSGFSVFLL